MSPEINELLEQVLSLSDDMVRELAGAGLQFDEYKVKLDSQTALSEYLFDEMPAACVQTDPSGVIIKANRAAALLLNTSVRHLNARLLMHFVEDRDQFREVLRALSAANGHHRCALVVRPRERAPVAIDATVIARSPGEVSSWLWFFAQREQPQPGHRRQVRHFTDAAQTVAN